MKKWVSDSKWTTEQWCILCPLPVALGKTLPVRYSRRQMLGPLQRVFRFSRMFFEFGLIAKPSLRKKHPPPPALELLLRRQIWVFFDFFFFSFSSEWQRERKLEGKFPTALSSEKSSPADWAPLVFSCQGASDELDLRSLWRPSPSPFRLLLPLLIIPDKTGESG